MEKVIKDYGFFVKEEDYEKVKKLLEENNIEFEYNSIYTAMTKNEIDVQLDNFNISPTDRELSILYNKMQNVELWETLQEAAIYAIKDTYGLGRV